jgi:hypothetical protein
MLPLSLFRHRMFALTSLVGVLVNVAIYGLIFVLSLYFQQVNGLSAFATGLAFVPMMGAVLPVNLIAPRVTEAIGTPHYRRRRGAVGSGMSGNARHRGRFQLLGDLRAADHDELWPRIAGAAPDLDPARQRGQITFRHRRWRAQRKPANRQRAWGCVV